MLSVLLDQANILYFLLGTAALALVVYGWLRGRARYWLYAGVCVALIGVLWLLGQLVITDRKQIVLNLDAMAKATVDQLPDALFRHVSRDFRFGNLSREETYARVKA